MHVAGGSDVLLGEEDGADDVFFCVAASSRGKTNKMSYFHSNAVGEDAEAARELAALCLDYAPAHHRWHHHTVAGRRTFAFLAADDGRTYFAVADPTPGSAETVRFLERVRDACNAAPRKRPRDGAVAPVVRQFVQTMQVAARTARTSSSMANAALRGDSPGEPACTDGEKDEEAQYTWPHHRAVQPEEGARRPGRLSWWRRHAVVVIVVDVVLCLVLFGVWMFVCHGLTCVLR